MSRILVIDDDRGVTGVLKRGLTYEGYTVDTADSGYEGLTIARDRVPDLVILDLMLPGLDGLGVLERLRSADAHLPVIMLGLGAVLFGRAPCCSGAGWRETAPALTFHNGDSDATHFNTYRRHELRRLREQRPQCAHPRSRCAGRAGEGRIGHRGVRSRGH